MLSNRLKELAAEAMAAEGNVNSDGLIPVEPQSFKRLAQSLTEAAAKAEELESRLPFLTVDRNEGVADNVIDFTAYRNPGGDAA